MITDALLRLSEDQAITVDAVSENTIDLGTARDIGEGSDLYVNILVTEAFATGTDVTFSIITSAAAALTSPTILVSSDAIVIASLTVGDRIVLRIPPQVGSLGQRYLGLDYNVNVTMTAGKVTADIVETIQDGKKYYASGFSVS